ncbi:hypothetical protein I4U23_000144 [Adineta vaga]|nr:hypothetical protein I4U23_000144 [Adineta vaga]
MKTKDPPISLGQSSILANLYENNIDVLSKSYAVNFSSFHPDDVTNYIMKNANESTDVALGAFIWNEKFLQIILNKLKKEKYPGRIILGGPQISYTKKNLEKFYPQVDVFIRGYGETALLQYMQQQIQNRYPQIQGIHYAGQIDQVQSAKTNFNELPSPFLKNLIPNQRFLRWETQRGCPFSCSFCQHRESTNLTRRHFELTRISKEIQWLCRNESKVIDLNLVDPTFNSGPNYLNVLQQLIQYKYQGKITLQTRLEMIKPEFINAIVQLNQTAMVVLEFGLQTIHPNEQKFIDRPSNMKKIQRILNEIYEKSIECEISLIFGLPGQTIESFEKSIEFCLKHHVQIIHAFPLMLLRGTPLYEQKYHLKLIESDQGVCDEIDRIQQYGIKHVVSSPTFSYSDWRKMAQLAGNLEIQNNSYLKKRDEKYVQYQQNINKPNDFRKESI